MSNARTFSHVAVLIKDKRMKTAMSQSELSTKMGYKNGQFISNVERGICSLPGKKILIASELLNISRTELMTAIMKDYELTLRDIVQKSEQGL